MNLTNLNDMPKYGYIYYEPAINWHMPSDVALQGLDIATKALQVARANNPHIGLDPGYEACQKAIGAYTCTRLTPAQRHHFCGGEPATEQERAQLAAAQKEAAKPKGCTGCGGRR